MNRSSLTAAWTSTFGAARHAVHATCWVLQGGSRVDPPPVPDQPISDVMSSRGAT